MIFTEELANKSLVLVRPIVLDIIRKDSEIKKMLKKEKNSRSQESLIKKFKQEINYHLKELETIGCVLRNRHIGAVAFPINDLKLSTYLSWTIGEPAVSLIIREGETSVHIRPYVM